MRLLFVHGIAQGGKDPVKLKETWLETLQAGFAKAGRPWPKNVAVDFPYYGDILDGFVAQESLPLPDDVLTKGPGTRNDLQEFMSSVLNEMAQRGVVTEAQIRARMDPQAPQEKGLQNWSWIIAIAQAIDAQFTPLSEFFIEQFLKEVFVYARRGDAAEIINDTVLAKLTGEPTVVVGHSLGSVVAYNVLRHNSAGRDIRGFVTVGSPLAIKALAASLGALEYPVAKTVGWLNAYDKKDIVALNPLKPAFKVTLPLRDYDEVKNTTSNHHGIIGYLNDPKVAEHIAQVLLA